MSHNRIEIEREGRVVVARLSNPPYGFMDREMVAGLDELVSSLVGDRSVGSVVITGGQSGRFVTHYDVAEILAGTESFGAEVGPRAAGATLAATGGLRRLPLMGAALKRTQAGGVVELQQIHDLFLRMNRLDKVFIAAIGGPAMGGGCELALSCDLRLMAKGEGRIGLPETTLGILPGAGGTQRMARAVGTARALEMILEGEALEAEAAVEAGLVNRAVPATKLLEEAMEVAERMARRAPGSIAGAKQALYFGASKPLADGLAEERRHFLSAGSAPEAHRAMAAYVAELEESGKVPAADGRRFPKWQAGEVVDMGAGTDDDG
ncbi:MAG: enoyl-CoA hydratase/isomerase family protein [Solirubrobacterales bacterium]